MYTEDNLQLPTVHFVSDEKDICVIFIHGMCGTILKDYFAIVKNKEKEIAKLILDWINKNF